MRLGTGITLASMPPNMRASPSFHRKAVYPLIAVIFLAGLWSVRTPAAGGDAVLDAKRKAAAQLLKDGKPADALALMDEVTRVEDGFWADWLLMAHASEKLGRTAEAAGRYKRVTEFLATSSTADERAARAEAERKLKLLDPVGPKIDQAVDEYLRKLDALEKDAIAARSVIAMEQIFRLRGCTWLATKAKDRGYAEVHADGGWQDAGIDVIANKTYHIRAAGAWSVLGAAGNHVECTAAGTQARTANGYGRMGKLMGAVLGKQYPLGEDIEFTPIASGRLSFIENEDESNARQHNSGAIQVLVIQKN
jgi:hypothetical protein